MRTATDSFTPRRFRSASRNTRPTAVGSRAALHAGGSTAAAALTHVTTETATLNPA
jgi:hypothetical protein